MADAERLGGIAIFLSTPSARRATKLHEDLLTGKYNFYPRPPRGGRPSYRSFILPTIKFLSTPSARRATRPHQCAAVKSIYFYPRPPRGGRRERHRAGLLLSDFYPRPPRGGRPACVRRGRRPSGFLSTPSARRATAVCSNSPVCRKHFYPRPPRGGRRHRWCRCCCPPCISIHALREEGDPTQSPPAQHGRISIHALREEGDELHPTKTKIVRLFLSTPSARRATLSWWMMRLSSIFLSTPSARRATNQQCRRKDKIRISIHALREEGDLYR